jgi:hypothetical protein
MSFFNVYVYVYITPLFFRTANHDVVTNRLNLSLSQISFRDPVTGLLSDITAAWNNNNCSTGMDLSTTMADCVFAASPSVSSTCNNAIQSIEYNVLHNKDIHSSITDISFRVVVTDVSYTEFAGSFQNQNFGIDFFDDAHAYTDASVGIPLNRFAILLLYYNPIDTIIDLNYNPHHIITIFFFGLVTYLCVCTLFTYAMLTAAIVLKLLNEIYIYVYIYIYK